MISGKETSISGETGNMLFKYINKKNGLFETLLFG